MAESAVLPAVIVVGAAGTLTNLRGSIVDIIIRVTGIIG